MTRAELPNGIRVLAKANRLSPAVVVRLCLQTGAVHDPQGGAGAALATGLLLDEGTKLRSGKEIAELIDYIGAETGGLLQSFLPIENIDDFYLIPSIPQYLKDNTKTKRRGIKIKSCC